MSAAAYCDARQDGLRCDRGPGHTGRHCERWVATWAANGGDVREYAGSKNGRSVYRSVPTGQEASE